MKVYFDSENINPDLPGIVILSHGPLAKSLIDSVELLYMGKLENAAAFCLESGDDLDNYRKEFVTALKSFPAGLIVFVDMAGGSPSNQLLLASQKDEELKDKEIYAIAGVNLMILLNAAIIRNNSNAKQLHKTVLKDAKDTIVNLTKSINDLRNM